MHTFVPESPGGSVHAQSSLYQHYRKVLRDSQGLYHLLRLVRAIQRFLVMQYDEH
jgi:hypothetical protein